MAPTGDVEVTVEDWDAKPVSGASVSFAPNQTWLNGGSQILGEGIDTLTYLRAGGDKEPLAARRRRADLLGFTAITDSNGKAIVRNLPAGIGIYEHDDQERQNLPFLGFYVAHDNYKLVPKEPQRIFGAGPPRETVDMIPLGLAKIRARMDRFDNPRSAEVVSKPSKATPKPDRESTAKNKNVVEGKKTSTKKAEPSDVPTKPITVVGIARDLQGLPVEGATIHLISLNGITKRINSTTTDSVGRYTFENAEMPLKGNAGTIQVYGIAEGYGLIWHGMRFVVFGPRPANQPKSPEDHSFFEDEPIEMDLEFPPAAKLHGRVLDEKEQPVANATIDLGNLDFLDTDGKTMHHNFREIWWASLSSQSNSNGQYER